MTGRKQIFAIASGLAALAAGTFAGPEAQDPDRAFRHIDHVPEAWMSGEETMRDCRGCHAYSENPSNAHDPQAVCAACHSSETSSFAVRTATGYERDLAPLRDARSPLFVHTDHGSLACGECHRPDPSPGSMDPMPIRRGAVECARCHGPGDPPDFAPVPRDQDIDEQKLRAGFLARLNESPTMSPDELGPFHHREHLSDPAISFTLEQLTSPDRDAGTCTTCHLPVLTAGAGNLAVRQVDLASCATCHRDATDALVFAAINEPGASGSALTFAHSDHLRLAGRDPSISNPPGYQRIESEGCSACHGHAPAETGAGEWSFHVSGSETEAFTYAGCATCHDSATWRTTNHGEWTSCQSCHTFGAGEMKTNRPTASVRRSGPTPFRIETQTHPFITIGEGELSPDCRECHRAPVTELPSRLLERAFNHTTHLPAEPGAEDCDRCHAPRVHTAASSAALGWPPESGQTLLSYDPQACAQCHRGGQVQAMPPAPDEPRTVVEFSHDQHLGVNTVDGQPIRCMSCHEPRAGVPVGVLPGALDCTLCHDHVDTGALWRNTGGIRGTDVTSCASCHTSGIPEVQAELLSAHMSISGIAGTQFHPADQDCSSCHFQEQPDEYRIDADHVFGIGGRLPGSRRSDRHPPGQPRPQDCLQCHWSVQPTGSREDPQAPAVRRRFGDVLDGFPGLGGGR